MSTLYFSPDHYGAAEATLADQIVNVVAASGTIVFPEQVTWTEMSTRISRGDPGLYLIGAFPLYFSADAYRDELRLVRAEEVIALGLRSDSVRSNGDIELGPARDGTIRIRL